MNVHKNARSCPISRELLARRVCEQGWSVLEASEAAGMSERRGREWVRRWRAKEPMTDRNSRPHAIESTEQATRERVLSLRREWRTVRQIALAVGVGASTAARICRAAGLSRLRHLEAPKPPVRYEREKAGELLHVDIKRLGRFDRVGHRITRKRSFGSPKQGFEFVYVAIDDFTRLSYVDILADERSESASTFLTRAVEWFALQKIKVERVMTDMARLPGWPVCQDLCGAQGSAQAHSPLHATHEWEGRAIHPDIATGVGVSLLVPHFGGA
jgi:transposase